MSNKLWLVKCRGMQSRIAGQTVYGFAYVVAENPDEAYKKVRESLDRRDLGFSQEREMESIELLAEQSDYPDCGTILYL